MIEDDKPPHMHNVTSLYDQWSIGTKYGWVTQQEINSIRIVLPPQRVREIRRASTLSNKAVINSL